ncbi:hypothetical protein [Extibacter muris]|uniref:hypothetical protein n=1 Tax=Extibacter muris TaxID=1796622 RepID=UPI001D08F6A4|nr:hypothetical protein [Extibacter muris]MCB6202131.1 hypothetical protein [Extibacter muris]MCQ4662566.1 hypothetical protein [Extibacter muris]MCQ4693200.1 hypothetical protein [Extibacter muris]
MLIQPLSGKIAGRPVGRESQKMGSAQSFSEVMDKSLEKAGAEVKESRPTSVKSKTLSNVQFSGSYEERIEQINKLNAQTDWGAMSDVEKVRTFEERYLQAFGDEKLFLVGSMYTSYSHKYEIIYMNYVSEKQKYFDKGGPAQLSSKYTDCYREVKYSGLSEEEVRMAIQEKWQGTGCLEDKFAILAERLRCGVGSARVESGMMYAIEMEIFDKVEKLLGPGLRGTGMRPTDHPLFSEYYMTFAKGVGEGAGYRLNWTQIAEVTLEGYKNVCRQGNISPEELEKRKGMLDEFLDDIRKGN